MYRATAVEAGCKGNPITAEQINQATTLATAKPMAMNTYKLDLARGLMARALQQVA
jgi:CO/xanthine dehydrogenase FAD-binding subunit